MLTSLSSACVIRYGQFHMCLPTLTLTKGCTTKCFELAYDNTQFGFPLYLLNYRFVSSVAMTLAELIEEALMTNTDVAAAAGLSPGTVSRMVNGHPTSRLSVRKVLSVLSRKLGRKIEISDIEGLNISD